MVTCNITGASGFITGAKEIRTKLDICFPYGSGGQPRPQGFSLKKWPHPFFKEKALGTRLSGGVTYVVKASYFVLAYKLLCGDNKLK